VATSDKNILPPGGLSSHELLVLMEMCVDAEERCERRARAATELGNKEAAANAEKQRETYRDLKFRLFRAMKEPTSTDDVLETARQVRRELDRLGAPPQVPGTT
jgi:hypothetical protein